MSKPHAKHMSIAFLDIAPSCLMTTPVNITFVDDKNHYKQQTELLGLCDFLWPSNSNL